MAQDFQNMDLYLLSPNQDKQLYQQHCRTISKQARPEVLPGESASDVEEDPSCMGKAKAVLASCKRALKFPHTFTLEEEDAHIPRCHPIWWGKVLAFSTLWWVSSSTVVVTMKHVISKVGDDLPLFPHSFSFTSMNQPLAALFVWLLSVLILDREKQPLPKLRWDEVTKIVAVAVMAGIEVALGNKAMQFLNVSNAQMLKSLSVLFVMLSANCWGLEALGMLRIASAMLLSAGAALQTFSNTSSAVSEDASHQWIVGSAMIMTCLFSSGQRWVLCQWIFQEEKQKGSALAQMSKPQLLARILPISTMVTLPLAAVFEPEALQSEALRNPDLYIKLVAVSLGISLLLFAEFNLVHYLSAVGFNVAAAVHQIPIILSGVVIDHNQLSQIGCIGYAVCIVGAWVYAVARYREDNGRIMAES